MAKHLFVTGSVVSCKDKGIATPSYWQVLKSQETVTALIKLDPCSNNYPDVSCHKIQNHHATLITVHPPISKNPK